MDKLGMLALGAFVGGVLSLGLPLTKTLSVDEFRKVAIFVLGSAFTGPVFVLIAYFGGSKLGEALFAYPVGLGLENIRDADKNLQERIEIAGNFF